MLDSMNHTFVKAKSGLGKIPCYNVDPDDDVIVLVDKSKDVVEEKLLKYGGLLIRGAGMRSLSEFSKLSNIISPNLFDYVNRSTPRTKLGGKIYTSTEYPAEKAITFHNENAYTNKWPNKVMFFCIIPSETGGETAIADSRYVLQNIDKEIIDIFEKKKILYKRNYSRYIDLSWREVFQTEDKSEVEEYCKNNGINFQWREDDTVDLTTKQVCQATLEHPKTKEKVWFNQAHLFNVCTIKAEDIESIVKLVGKENLPRNSYFGDGTEIPRDYIKHILDAYEKERIEFPWRKGDIMILDNVLMTHSRNPYTGKRKVVVSMGE
ncbi:TauD/TfdA family dioxygenase [Candidatus Bandiella numerosa]|uniref:TauD/TfdA family dioxygenase n=1 Tax=Candidatus Bandiella numerosa TaxID=2570586 RepID=UPI00249E3F2D|nr:TauD/TfdA family dioxygenase [Candidatus Bandiella numerosa]WHA04418.1 TauD/TfdA family dioxygenase [Candidatus Bandiella numerosa]